MVEVTILTPTYNRGDMLRRVYKSLLQQTNTQFEWLIVDDGSTDSTDKLVEELINENRLSIKYIYKENGGKHTAVNKGVENIDTPLTLILDSDDYLTSDAVEIIVKYYYEYKDYNNLCGFVFLKIYPNGTLNGKTFPINKEICSFIDRRVNGKIHGDKCEVLYTKILKKYSFPEFEGEKFISESTTWIAMGMKYDMVYINEKIYVAEYLADGLTKQGKKLRILSPNGSMENARVRMNKKTNLRRRIKGSILYSCYGYFAKKKAIELISNNEHKILTISTLPIGFFLYIMWKIKYNIQ